MPVIFFDPQYPQDFKLWAAEKISLQINIPKLLKLPREHRYSFMKALKNGNRIKEILFQTKFEDVSNTFEDIVEEDLNDLFVAIAENPHIKSIYLPFCFSRATDEESVTKRQACLENIKAYITEFGSLNLTFIQSEYKILSSIPALMQEASRQNSLKREAKQQENFELHEFFDYSSAEQAGLASKSPSLALSPTAPTSLPSAIIIETTFETHTSFTAADTLNTSETVASNPENQPPSPQARGLLSAFKQFVDSDTMARQITLGAAAIAAGIYTYRKLTKT